MSDKIAVTVVITTYAPNEERAAVAERTIKSFSENLNYPNLHWIISDDGSPNHNEFMERLKQYVPDAETLNINRGGVGKSKNTALAKAFERSHLVFLSEDDWLLSEPLDLLTYVQLMLDYGDICMVRFGFLGGEFTAKYTGYGYPLDFWSLQRDSGLYVYSGQVSLRAKSLYDIVGWHKEGVDAGTEELDFCHRYNNTSHNLKILWPAKFGCTIDSSPFKNIGMGTSLNAVTV